MTRLQVLATFLFGYLLATAGVVWKFGEYGLMGAGVVLLVLASFINAKE